MYSFIGKCIPDVFVLKTVSFERSNNINKNKNDMEHAKLPSIQRVEQIELTIHHNHIEGSNKEC